MKSCGVTIQMKATEQYFPVVLFIMQYKVVLTFESMDEILWCDHSNESYWAVRSCGTVYYAVQGGSNFRVCDPAFTRSPYKPGGFSWASSPWEFKGHRLLWSVLYLSHLRLYSPHRLPTFICQTNKLRSLSPNYSELICSTICSCCNKDFTYF